MHKPSIVSLILGSVSLRPPDSSHFANSPYIEIRLPEKCKIHKIIVRTLNPVGTKH